MFNNTTERVVDDLRSTIKPGDRIAIASVCFSIYAFQALREQLMGIKELRFLFTSPTFIVPEKFQKEPREYYIPRRGRENSIYGTAFEVRLKNELTQKAIARECADWIREKVKFKTNLTTGSTTPVMTVNSDVSYMPLGEFTTVGLGADRGNSMSNFVTKLEVPQTRELLSSFDAIWNDTGKVKDVTNEVLEGITAAYRENAPELIYYLTLSAIFNEFLEDINNDLMPDEAVGFKNTKIWNFLYDFQKDAVLSIIHKLEKFNGCILADSVGLGKTFTALGVMKYYEKRNKNVLVLCPKKLANNWNTYHANYKNNPLIDDRFSYQVLFHTDLNRKRGKSNGVDLALFNWENYDLVVIDESHNFRNGGHVDEDEDGNVKLNRYSLLMENVIKKGVKTKVLMLSATPVNNRFVDLRNQLELAYEGDSSELEEKLQTSGSVKEIFRQAQKAFSEWAKLEEGKRSLGELLSRLSVDFFTVLDAVTIARSRKHIRDYYNVDSIGQFPERLPPQNHSPELTDLKNAPTYDRIYETLEYLNLMAYVPTGFIHPSKLHYYSGQKGFREIDAQLLALLDDEDVDSATNGLTQLGREKGIRKLMGIGLMKRLESSIWAFATTIRNVIAYMEQIVDRIDEYEKHPVSTGEGAYVGRKILIRLEDMDWKSYRERIKADITYLTRLGKEIETITPEHDLKLRELTGIIKAKLAKPVNEGNRKVLIFSAFADTANYLYEKLSDKLKEEDNLNLGIVTGDSSGSKTTLKKCQNDFNEILTCFSPRSKEKGLLFAGRADPGEIDVLIATDCISEGQNLQDCDMVINYDIHWNPCRIIQRYGRIDRIGSLNGKIQLVNFWPNVSLDRYIKLRDRVETRMKALNLAATGDDNPIALDDPELEFRKRQLERLKKEAVDLEDMSDGISIMDLGLSEFQQDLLSYTKQYPGKIEHLPRGINAVAEATSTMPPGIIFVLRNINSAINKNQANRLHPYYLVYVNEDGSVREDCANSKEVLEAIRLLAKNRKEYDPELVADFNRETGNGKNMKKCSELLGAAIASLVEHQSQSNVNELFNGTEISSALENNIEGIDDFELVTFLVVRKRKES